MRFGWFSILLLIMVWLPKAEAVAQIDWGIRAGLGRTSFTQKVDLDYESGSQLGYSFGVLADIHLHRRFSLRPEISLENQGGRYFTLRDESSNPALKYHSRYFSLQIPVNLAFNIPISGVRMTIYGGPAPDFSLGGKMKLDQLEPVPFDLKERDLKTFDLGINGGISVEYKRIFFSIDAYFGTLDRRANKHENESKVYHNNLTFSLGYIFRHKNKK